ncbi:MAG: group II intron reverse transcriptase/maturase [Nitrosomonadaceae bacterium]
MRSQTVSTKLKRIAEQAVQNPDMVFTTLVHHIDVDFLHEAYVLVNKRAVPGLDGVTSAKYGENLSANLENLHKRLKEGKYRAPVIKRIWQDKEGGEKRPIGISEFEDKIAQRAAVMLLEAVYEQDFYDFSHGYRKNKSAHKALKELRNHLMEMGISRVADIDLWGFFDNIDRGKMLEILKKRVNDGGLLKLIGKWLNAGVLEENELSYPDKGTPQGGVISPILANIFLHHILDEWFEKEVKPAMKGRCFLIRFADDLVMGFELDSDSQRVMDVLPKRFGRFGLSVHPEKSKVVKFKFPGWNEKGDKDNETFDFLGFTHYWALSRRGYWVVKKKTIGKRLKRFMKGIWRWCKVNLHELFVEQHKKLCQKLRGYYQYYGITGNFRAINRAYEWLKYSWRFWLSRRCQKGYITIDRFEKLLLQYALPKPRIIHTI